MGLERLKTRSRHNFHVEAQSVMLPAWEIYLIRLCALAILFGIVWVVYRLRTRPKNKPDSN